MLRLGELAITAGHFVESRCAQLACGVTSERDQALGGPIQTAKPPEISVEEYLAGEEISQIKHEYIDGAAYAMSGGTRNHAVLAGNLLMRLMMHLRGRKCQAFNSDLKVQVEAVNCYYYPDLTVTCDPRDLGAPGTSQFVKHPCLVVEVLSKTTERVDRGEKVGAYRTLPSLQEYVLVDQYRTRVEVYRRVEQGWLHEILTTGDELHLHSVDLRTGLDAIYENVDFSLPVDAE